jgi:hypothetical protein
VAVVQCDGADVIRGRIHLPLRGPWWAELKLDTATAPSGQVTIEAHDGLSIVGTIERAAVFLDSAHVTLRGGHGGFAKVLSPSAYRNASFSDPLSTVLNEAGEAKSSTIAADILSIQLPFWTVNGETLSAELDELTYNAASALGEAVDWRLADDGSVWMGRESWDSASLPDGSDLIMSYPSEGRYVLGVPTLWLLPGVELENIGRVQGVDHWIEGHELRTWAWI